MAFGIRGLVLGQQLIIVILKNMGWRNIAKHQTRHGKQKKQKTTQKNIIHKQCKRRGKPAGKKKTKHKKKNKKKHENGTRKKQEKNTKQLKSTILASG
jgi:hypothetical protein